MASPTPDSSTGLGPAPPASSYIARRTMEANRAKNTRPEIALRSALHRKGLRFRKDARLDLPKGHVRVDVVFRTRRVAVFVDGCFWHGCPEHMVWPKANAGWWHAKITGNQARDRAVDEYLRSTGWTVIRVWEHDDAEAAAGTIDQMVRSAAPRPTA